MARKLTVSKRHHQDFDEDITPKTRASRVKQKYPAESKAAHLQEGKQVSLKTKLMPRTYGQEFYLNTLSECTITVAAGPAGTGKTWLAAHFALNKLLTNQVSKLVITKPILEAGEEEIGFLPGDINEKVAPHFQSVLDAIEDHIGPAAAKALIDKGKIQFLPTAYCRGRDIKNAFILIDEAQNLTRKGIKLMMTRISEGSMMAINGDADQIDLKDKNDSGLAWAISNLRGKDSEIGIVEMTESDIQRHPLIRTILRALAS